MSIAKGRRRMRIAVQTLAGILLGTALVEAGLAVVEVSPLWRILPATEASFYGPDEKSGYAIRPGSSGLWLTENRVRVQMSPQGLRDHDTPFEKPKGVFRVVLAGDSILEALQVDLDDTFASLLEASYRVAGRQVEIVNLGQAGAVPAVQVARMDGLGQRFSPDLQAYMINVTDFVSPIMGKDDAFPGYVQAQDGKYRLGFGFRESRGYQFRNGEAGRAFYWVLDHSRVARILNSRRNQGFLPVTTQAAASELSVCTSRLDKLERALDGTGEAKVRDILLAFLDDVSSTAKATGKPAVLILRGLAPDCRPESGVLLAARLANLAADKGIGVIDLDVELSKVLRRDGGSAGQRHLYGFGVRVGQGHLNQFGHRVFAMALASGLRPWVEAQTNEERNSQ